MRLDNQIREEIIHRLQEEIIFLQNKNNKVFDNYEYTIVVNLYGKHKVLTILSKLFKFTKKGDLSESRRV